MAIMNPDAVWLVFIFLLIVLFPVWIVVAVLYLLWRGIKFVIDKIMGTV